MATWINGPEQVLSPFSGNLTLTPGSWTLLALRIPDGINGFRRSSQLIDISEAAAGKFHPSAVYCGLRIFSHAIQNIISKGRQGRIGAMDRPGQHRSGFSVNRATEFPLVILAILLRQVEGEDCVVDHVPSLDVVPRRSEMEQSHRNELPFISTFS